MNPQKESSRLFSSWLICRGFSLFCWLDHATSPFGESDQGVSDLEPHNMNPQKESSRLFSSWLICRGFSLFGGLVWLGCHILLPPLLAQRRFVVGKRDSNTSPHAHLGLSCCANTCNLTAFWFPVIVCPMY